MTAIVAKVPAVMKKTLVIDSMVYAREMNDSRAPLMTLYATNISVAVASERRLIAPLTPKTNANSAMMSPKKRALFVTNAFRMPGLVATPYAVTPVRTSARVIHTYTLRINTGNA